MTLDNFLNPLDEQVQDNAEDLTKSIAQQFDQPEPESEDEVILPKVQHQQAIQLLQQLRLYELQQINGHHGLIQQLDQHEALIKSRKVYSTQQASITRFFGSN